MKNKLQRFQGISAETLLVLLSIALLATLIFRA